MSQPGARKAYPCVYDIILLCAAASDQRDRLASFSNFHPGLEMVAAPGSQILTTKIFGGTDFASGTSLASPLIAGTIAEMRALYPDLHVSELFKRIRSTADRPAGLDGKVSGSLRMNSYRALFAPSARHALAPDPYCDELISSPQSPHQTFPRRDNWPYANFDEPGIDGTSFARAYTICTGRQLTHIRPEDLGRYFVLRRHIDWSRMDPGDRNQIGTYVVLGGTRRLAFNGVLDGNGYIIHRFAMGGNRDGLGLFGELGPGAQVADLRFTDARVTFRNGGGILAAKSAGRIVNVQASGKVVGERVVGEFQGPMPAVSQATRSLVGSSRAMP